MERYYIRVWNGASKRMLGWLGNKDGWAVCIPAGLYSNPISTPGAAVTEFEYDPHDAGRGKLSIKDESGALWLGGKGGGGVDAYWHAADRKDECYWLSVSNVDNGRFDSPVTSNMAGAILHHRDDRPFQLHAWYTAHNDVFGFKYLEDKGEARQIFIGDKVKLTFKADRLAFEFVPADSFAADGSDYVQAARSKHPNIGDPSMATWMGDLRPVIGDRRLADIVIPGGHDATSIDFDQLGELGNRRSRTQDRSIYDQLLAGVRYLDFRFKPYHGNTWYGNHGEDSNNLEISTALSDINRFLHEHPEECLLISLLPSYSAHVIFEQLNDLWQIVIKTLGEHIFPRSWRDADADRLFDHKIENLSPNALIEKRRRVVLFSWGPPPAGKLVSDKTEWDLLANYIWTATREDPDVANGPRPWQTEAANAPGGYHLDFDLNGVWLKSPETTANDIRLIVDAVEPPRDGALWAMHTNAPAVDGDKSHESVEEKAERIQPPLAKFVWQDPSMAAKLNVVNIDFAGKNDLASALVHANLLR